MNKTSEGIWFARSAFNEDFPAELSMKILLHEEMQKKHFAGKEKTGDNCSKSNLIALD